MSELTDAIDYFETTEPPPEVVYSKQQLIIIDAARKVANPDIEAAAKKVARFEFASDWPELTSHQWQIAHERAVIYVDAALGITTEDTE